MNSFQHKIFPGKYFVDKNYVSRETLLKTFWNIKDHEKISWFFCYFYKQILILKNYSNLCSESVSELQLITDNIFPTFIIITLSNTQIEQKNFPGNIL